MAVRTVCDLCKAGILTETHAVLAIPHEQQPEEPSIFSLFGQHQPQYRKLDICTPCVEQILAAARHHQSLLGGRHP